MIEKENDLCALAEKLLLSRREKRKKILPFLVGTIPGWKGKTSMLLVRRGGVSCVATSCPKDLCVSAKDPSTFLLCHWTFAISNGEVISTIFGERSAC